MMTSVTRSCFTTQHQTCKTKTDFLVSDLRPTVSDHITDWQRYRQKTWPTGSSRPNEHDFVFVIPDSTKLLLRHGCLEFTLVLATTLSFILNVDLAVEMQTDRPWAVVAQKYFCHHRNSWISLLVYCAEMEAENKLYADVHGDGQGQPSQEPPNYTPTAPEQQQQPQPDPSGVPSQPYPQYGPYPTTGTPFYAPPAAAGYGTIPVCVQQPAPRFTGAIIYACCVMWSCNWLFGLFAFGLACEYFTLYSSLQGAPIKSIPYNFLPITHQRFKLIL